MNPYGKRRPVNNPHAIYRNNQGWTWRILKVNQAPKNGSTNRYCSAFCHVTSPFAPQGEMGDTYLNDIGPIHVEGAHILQEYSRHESAA